MRAICSATSQPDAGRMMMSVCLMSLIAQAGVRPTEQGHVTLRPSIEATFTRKRGCGASPWSQFHNRPAEWKTSIGAIAVDA